MFDAALRCILRWKIPLRVNLIAFEFGLKRRKIYFYHFVLVDGWRIKLKINLFTLTAHVMRQINQIERSQRLSNCWRIFFSKSHTSTTQLLTWEFNLKLHKSAIIEQKTTSPNFLSINLILVVRGRSTEELETERLITFRWVVTSGRSEKCIWDGSALLWESNKETFLPLKGTWWAS